MKNADLTAVLVRTAELLARGPSLSRAAQSCAGRIGCVAHALNATITPEIERRWSNQC